MTKRAWTLALLGVACLTVALAACSPAPSPEPLPSTHETGAQTPEPSPTPTYPVPPRDPTPPPPAAPTESPPDIQLPSKYPPGTVVLGTLPSVRGIAELGPFHPGSAKLAVSTICYGSGVLHVTIPGVAEYEQNCSGDPADPGIQNTFALGDVGAITVRGSSDESNLWAMVVTTTDTQGG